MRGSRLVPFLCVAVSTSALLAAVLVEGSRRVLTRPFERRVTEIPAMDGWVERQNARHRREGQAEFDADALLGLKPRPQ
jgi:hypothetical protein